MSESIEKQCSNKECGNETSDICPTCKQCFDCCILCSICEMKCKKACVCECGKHSCYKKCADCDSLTECNTMGCGNYQKDNNAYCIYCIEFWESQNEVDFPTTVCKYGFCNYRNDDVCQECERCPEHCDCDYLQGLNE